MAVKLTIKPGVKFDHDSLALGRILATLLLWDYDGEVVITAGSNGTHAPKSRHYTGEAVDIRTHNFTLPVDTLRASLQAALGPKFVVIWESPNTPNSHLHVQVRKATTYP